MATQVTERYCPICGEPVADTTHNRFGEWCCSDAHAEEYVPAKPSEARSCLARAADEQAITKPVETTEHCCPICGKDVTDPAFKRFGEWACSEAHAEQYVKEVRAERAQAPPDRSDDDRYAARPSRWGWFGRRRGC